MAKLLPGEFRVSDRAGPDGKFRLRGRRSDGASLSMKVASLTEGHTLGQTLFKGAQHVARPLTVTLPGAAPPELDDFGLPIGLKLPQVSADTISATAPPNVTTTAAGPTAKKQSERNTNAKTLTELIGLGAAAGTAISATKFLEARYEVVPKPSKKHLSELADNVQKGLSDMFGDREVGPWTMALLLILGIPIAMWLQSSEPKKKTEATTAEKANLASVP